MQLQLAEALGQLHERDRQLTHEQGRSKALRRELDVATRKAQLRVLERERVVEASRGDALDGARAKLELARAQLEEEVARRRRSDDRSRVLKECSEKFRARGAELEAAAAAAATIGGETRASLGRARHELRETQAALEVSRAQAQAQEDEAARQRVRAENAEYLQRNVRLDAERLRADVGDQRRALQASQEIQEALQAELLLLKQRYAARSAQTRILEMAAPQTVTAAPTHAAASAPAPVYLSVPAVPQLPPPATASEPTGTGLRMGLRHVTAEEEDAEPVARRRPQPHYSAPSQASSGSGTRQPHTQVGAGVGGGRGQGEMTAMGIKRRVEGLGAGARVGAGARAVLVSASAGSSFLLDDDDDDDDVGSTTGGLLLHRAPLAAAQARRSAASLEEALLTQNLGLSPDGGTGTRVRYGLGDGSNDDNVNVNGLDSDSDDESVEVEVEALRRAAAGMQRAALDRADELRASIDSLGDATAATTVIADEGEDSVSAAAAGGQAQQSRRALQQIERLRALS